MVDILIVNLDKNDYLSDKEEDEEEEEVMVVDEEEEDDDESKDGGRSSCSTGVSEWFPLSKDGYGDGSTPPDGGTAVVVEESSHDKDDGTKGEWDDDISDDDDDVTVTINAVDVEGGGGGEESRLKRLLESGGYYYTDGYLRNCDAKLVYQLRKDDMELNQEIDRLVATSVRLRTTKVITVFVRNTLILVPTHVPISSRLADHIWPTADRSNAHPYRFKNMDLFNGLLPPETDRLETMAFFAARYKKTQVVAKHGGGSCCYRPPKRADVTASARQATGQSYLYDDFTLVIVSGGKVVDAAIHGVRGNINQLVAKYRPRRIYCNMVQGDALDVFLNYPHQPFYDAFRKLIAPMYVDTSTVRMNTIPFCDRHDAFCSFCKTLLTVVSFFKRTPTTPRFLQRIILSSDQLGGGQRRIRRPATKMCRRRKTRHSAAEGSYVVVTPRDRRPPPTVTDADLQRAFVRGRRRRRRHGHILPPPPTTVRDGSTRRTEDGGVRPKRLVTVKRRVVLI